MSQFTKPRSWRRRHLDQHIISFDELTADYAQASRALIQGGVDMLLIETVFDIQNAGAALSAARGVMSGCGVELPIIVSATINGAGQTLCGHTLEDFWNSIRDARPAVEGLNCILADHQLRPFIEALAHLADCHVCVYPSAGLPDASGVYDQTAQQMAYILGEFARSGLLNMVGGCCGTTPEHIRAMANAVDGVPARVHQGAGL